MPGEISSHRQIDRLYRSVSGRRSQRDELNRTWHDENGTPTIHTLISGVPAQLIATPSALATVGVINGTPSISTEQTVNGRSTIKIDATHSAGVRYVQWNGGPGINATPTINSTAINAFREPYKFQHGNEIGCDIYIVNVTGISDITLVLTLKNGGGTTTWTRSASQDSNRSLANGWNKLRFVVNNGGTTGWGDPTPEIQNIRLQFTVVSNNAAGFGSVMYLDRIYMVEPPRASILFVNDMAVRWFMDGTDASGNVSGGYPDLLARGLPCVFATQPGFWRDGDVATDDPTYQRPKVSEIVHLAAEGSEISYHSYANEQTGGVNAINANDFLSTNQMALARIRRAGIRMFPWRAAVLQNEATALVNNPSILEGLLYCCATPSGSAGLTIFPLPNRFNLPRTAIHNRSDAELDAVFLRLEQQRGFECHYTHYVANDATTVNTQVPRWQHYLELVDEGINEGWLEFVTMEQMFRRTGGRFIRGDGGAGYWEWNDLDGSVKRIPAS